MIDRDNLQRRVLGTVGNHESRQSSSSIYVTEECSWLDLPDGYSNCRLGERRVYGINGNGVVRICRITTDVHDHP